MEWHVDVLSHLDIFDTISRKIRQFSICQGEKSFEIPKEAKVVVEYVGTYLCTYVKLVFQLRTKEFLFTKKFCSNNQRIQIV